MQKFEAQALSQMAEGLTEYNKGVLLALGHRKLFDAWSSALIGLQLASNIVASAEQAASVGKTFGFGEYPEIDPALRSEVTAQRSRVNAAWAPIQQLKDQALDALSAADPFGMGQAT